MKDPDFAKKISVILRQLSNLRAAQRGDAGVARVYVKAHDVSAHRRGGHYRIVVVRRQVAARATKTRRAA